MALIDAPLLDPYQMNMWVAARNDGVAGTGTHNDSYEGSTQAKFDALRSRLGMNTCGGKTPPKRACNRPVRC